MGSASWAVARPRVANGARAFRRSGKPPHLYEISEETGLSIENSRTFIGELEAHDLLGSGPSADVVRYAYPFTGDQTEHRVRVRGRKLHAVCAIDALGIAAMFGTDVVIESSCRVCGASIEIGTAQDGKSLSYAQPVNAVVWYDLAYSGCAAASCCRSIAFFYSAAAMGERPNPAAYNRLSAHPRRRTGSRPSPL